MLKISNTEKVQFLKDNFFAWVIQKHKTKKLLFKVI